MVFQTALTQWSGVQLLEGELELHLSRHCCQKMIMQLTKFQPQLRGREIKSRRGSQMIKSHFDSGIPKNFIQMLDILSLPVNK